MFRTLKQSKKRGGRGADELGQGKGKGLASLGHIGILFIYLFK